MRKYEYSIILMNRLNMPYKKQGKISNLMVYQLLNLQTQNALDLFRDRQGNFKIGFLKDINIYGSFIII